MSDDDRATRTAVRGLPEAELIVAWRADDRRAVVREFVDAISASA